jgi:hypothetical protein
MTAPALDRARAAKLQLTQLLQHLPELRGIGIAALDDGFGVKVNVSDMPPEGTIPSQIDGVPVIVEIAGGITPL